MDNSVKTDTQQYEDTYTAVRGRTHSSMRTHILHEDTHTVCTKTHIQQYHDTHI
jgi:hypothetical protein